MNKFDEFGLPLYRDRLKGMQIVLSDSQAGPGRTVKQEQGDIFCNHVQAFYPISVETLVKAFPQDPRMAGCWHLTS